MKRHQWKEGSRAEERQNVQGSVVFTAELAPILITQPVEGFLCSSFQALGQVDVLRQKILDELAGRLRTGATHDNPATQGAFTIESVGVSYDAQCFTVPDSETRCWHISLHLSFFGVTRKDKLTLVSEPRGSPFPNSETCLVNVSTNPTPFFDWVSEMGYKPLTSSLNDSDLRAHSRCRVMVLSYDSQLGPLNEVLSQLSGIQPHSKIIVMSRNPSVDEASEAISNGAFEYLPEPSAKEEFTSALKRAHQAASGKLRVHSFPARSQTHAIVGKSPPMVEVYKAIARVAEVQCDVLILGETGTGKELVARAIHQKSPRSHSPFIAINCSAIPENLLESELFGHVRGAFTGAAVNRKGLIEAANHGTLFLDEIGDLSASLQVKLLRVVQEREFMPVGANENRHVDVRIIAATHRDLDAFVEGGKFREDLYYRLKTVCIHLPPLRERLEDLPELTATILERICGRHKRDVLDLSEDAFELLCSYSWPGNIRELEHALEHAVICSSGQAITRQVLPPVITQRKKPRLQPKVSIQDEQVKEKERILDALQKVQFNKSEAAKLLGMSRVTLYRKGHRYGIFKKVKSALSSFVLASVLYLQHMKGEVYLGG